MGGGWLVGTAEQSGEAGAESILEGTASDGAGSTTAEVDRWPSNGWGKLFFSSLNWYAIHKW